MPGVTSVTVQRDVSVCYWESVSSHYLFAVPMTEPKDNNVMCLVLLSPDLKCFDGYAAMSWREISEGTAHSEWVWWNGEYYQGGDTLYTDRS